MSLRLCTACEVNLPDRDFKQEPSRPDGLSTKCMRCEYIIRANGTRKNSKILHRETGDVGGLYVLHFDSPLPDDELVYRTGDRQHYLGISKSIPNRIGQHRSGNGSKVTKMAHDLGIDFEVATIIPGSPSATLEYRLTKLGAQNFCSVCLENDAWREQIREKRDELMAGLKGNI